MSIGAMLQTAASNASSPSARYEQLHEELKGQSVWQPDGLGLGDMIVDDHSLVRAGIALLVGHQDDMELVGQAGTAAEAIKLASKLSSDIILLDVTMPAAAGSNPCLRSPWQRPPRRS
jgi:hypothetical protein